jgi:hypothetical protein
LVIRMGPRRPPKVDLHNAILDALNEFPFHSLRSLSWVLKRPLPTIRDHLITTPIKRDVNLYERIQFLAGAASSIFPIFAQSKEGWENEPFETFGNFWKRSMKWRAWFGPLN